MNTTRLRVLILTAIAILCSLRVIAQGTAFSYQGRLTGSGNPANGIFELRFSLYDAGEGGSQVGDAITNAPVAVSKGLFTVTLDFGTNAFTGAPRWLEIGVRTNGGGAFKTLATRQFVTSDPYSLFAARAGAVDWTNISGKPDLGTVPQLGVANTFTAGPQTILSGDSTNTGLVIRGTGGQTANLQEWQDSTGNALASVTAAGSFSGNGAGLTNLNGSSLANLDASNISSGTLADARLSANVPLLNRNQTFSGANLFNGVITMINGANSFLGSFSGNGSGLTGLNGDSINFGTLGDGRLSANVPLLNRNQAFTGSNTFSGVSLLTNSANSFAGSFSGNGSGLIGLNGDSINFGTLGDGRLSANVPLLNRNQVFTGSNTFSGVSLLTNSANSFVGSFSGNGAGLTNVSAVALTNLNAFNITSGTLADARLSTNVPLLNRNQAFTGSNTFSGVSAFGNASNRFVGVFIGNGAGLSNIVSTGTNFSGSLAGDVTGPTGTNTVARIRGVNVSATAPVANQYLRFDGANWTPAAIALASNVSGTLGVTNGGSGATTASAARANLGAAASGTNSDITSLTGLATPLSATQGGSGQSNFTSGDILYASTATTLARRAIGSAGQVLTVSASTPVWTNANGHDHLGQSWVGTNSDGLIVQSTATNGTGLHGLANTGGDSYGVFGESLEGFGAVGSGGSYGVYGYSPFGFALFGESGGGFFGPQLALLQENQNDSCRLRMGVNGGWPQWQITVASGATPRMSFHNGTTNVMFVDFVGNLTARTFNVSSDRAIKEDFVNVDPREVLARVARLPIQTWCFKEDRTTRHMGPMAQDFHEAFEIGPDDKHIATVDADGVALAAIQGLNQLVKEKDARIEALEKRLGQLERLVATLAAKKSNAP